ncbi:apolipoprotein N-acyltransferase, partial [Shewanella sp. 0m-11]
RATNNGVTAVVDEKGNITHQLPQFEAGVLVADIVLMKGHTLFTTVGQWPVLIVSFLIAIAVAIRKKIQ